MMKVYLIQNSDGLFYTGRRHKFYANRDFLVSAKIYPNLSVARNALSNLLYGTKEEDDWIIQEYILTKDSTYHYKVNGFWRKDSDAT